MSALPLNTAFQRLARSLSPEEPTQRDLATAQLLYYSGALEALNIVFETWGDGRLQLTDARRRQVLAEIEGAMAALQKQRRE